MNNNPPVASLFYDKKYRSEYDENYKSLISDIQSNKFYLNIEDYVKVYHDILDIETCKKLSLLIEKYPLKRKFTDDLNNLIRSGEYLDMTQNKKFDLYIRKVIDKVLSSVIKKYVGEVKSFYYSYGDSINYYHYQALKYTKNDYFKNHHDHYAETVNYSRLLSVCIYLNEDYEGGELEFPSIKKTFKFKTGDVIIFPSNWMFYHGVTPITVGNRYSITVWAGIDINKFSNEEINYEW